uniref:Uncharacterized protein n=1 Tax=Rhizophora mucronata TaxID=61149 RepID=A0A2P2QY27_RHIMU
MAIMFSKKKKNSNMKAYPLDVLCHYKVLSVFIHFG